MRGLADKAYAAGFNVVLLNQRNCGGTEQLSAGLYHSGLTARRRPRHWRTGRGRRPPADHRRRVFARRQPRAEARGRLWRCSPASAPRCLRRFTGDGTRGLRSRSRAAAELHLPVEFRTWTEGADAPQERLLPGRFAVDRLDAIRTVREFDEVYTAPHFGFRNASDYYHRASAMRVIDRIRVPALIITAEDDPFVPSPPFRERSVTSNPNIRVVITRHGGHCAFLADATEGKDGYWAEHEILAFANANTTPTTTPATASRTPAPVPALRA